MHNRQSMAILSVQYHNRILRRNKHVYPDPEPRYSRYGDLYDYPVLPEQSIYHQTLYSSEYNLGFFQSNHTL